MAQSKTVEEHVSLSQYSIRFNREEECDRTLYLFKILKHHTSMNIAMIATLLFKDDQQIHQEFQSAKSVEKYISTKKRITFYGRNVSNASVIIINENAKIMKLQKELKELQLKTKNERQSLIRKGFKNCQQMYTKYNGGLSYSVFNYMSQTNYLKVVAQSITMARACASSSHPSQPIHLLSIDKVKNRDSIIQNSRSGLLLDTMEKNIRITKKKLTVTINGSLYSSDNYIKMSSIDNNIINAELFHLSMAQIIGHILFEFEFSPVYNTAIIAFPAPEFKNSAVKALREHNEKGQKIGRVNLDYSTGTLVFSGKNLHITLPMLVANIKPPTVASDKKEIWLHMTLFADKIQHITCGLGRLCDPSGLYIKEYLTPPHELWNHLGGENKLVFYWDLIFSQFNEMQGRAIQANNNYICRIRFTDINMDHAASKNVTYTGNEDFCSYHKREFWLILRFCGKIRLDLKWICEIFEWSVEDAKMFCEEWKNLHGTAPTKSTCIFYRKQQKLICAAVPTKEPLPNAYKNINLNQTFVKFPLMHDSLWLCWDPMEILLPHLPNCIYSQQIMKQIKGLQNPGEKVVHSIAKIRQFVTSLTPLAPYFRKYENLIVNQTSYAIYPMNFIVNEVIYSDTGISPFFIALYESYADIYFRFVGDQVEWLD
eukprot:399313_1